MSLSIIAIDGIDHAARAGVDQHFFLDTLIPSDAVPQNVRFLIEGQLARCLQKISVLAKGTFVGRFSLVVEDIQEEDLSDACWSTKSGN